MVVELGWTHNKVNIMVYVADEMQDNVQILY